MALPEMMSAWTEGLIRRRDKADRFSDVLQGLSRERDVEKRMLGDDTDAGADRQTKIRRILNRRQQRFRDLRDALADVGRTAFIIVLAAERMPVLESVELHASLRRSGVNVGGLVVNKRLPAGIDDPFFAERRAQEEAHLQVLEERLPGVPRQDLPLAAHDVTGVDALRQFAATL
jgi:arsenite-transporting ATPase